MRFVVIEGLDGSGKSTQLSLLGKYLENESIPHRYLHFPRLEEGVYGKLIARFLRGEMGSLEEVDPYLVALIFAGDRADAAGILRDWMKEGALVIVDRYVYSNIAFQCAKLADRDAQARLRDWILELEFGHNRLPRPDINLYLDVPLEFTRKQLGNTRSGTDRGYLKGERDIHEEKMEFQEEVRRQYLKLEGFVDDLRRIECMDSSGRMLEPEHISERIIQHIGN